MPRFVHCIACARWSALLMILLSLLCGTVATAEDARNSDGTSDKKPELSWPSAWPTEVTKPLRSEKLSKAKDGAARAKSNAADSDTKRELPQAVPEVSRPTDEASTPEAGASPKRVEGAAQEPAIRPKKTGQLAEPVQLAESLAREIEIARSLSNRLGSVEKAVNRVRDRDDELNQRLPTIDKIIADAVAAASLLRPDRADIKSQIDRLGSAPKEGDNEAESIAKERQHLNAIYAEVDGAIKSAELTVVRGRQLLSRIQELRLQIFRRGLLSRSPTLISPSLWSDAIETLNPAGAEIVAIFSDWVSRVRGRFRLVVFVLGAALGVGIALHIGARRVRRRMRKLPIAENPPFAKRVLIAGLDAPLRMLPKIASAAIVYIGLQGLSLLYLQLGGLADAALKAVVISAASTAFATTYLQPARPDWRIIDFGDAAAWRVRKIVRFTIYLFALDVFVRAVISELALPLSVNILWTSLVCFAYAITFLRGARTQLAKPETSDRPITFITGPLIKGLLAIATIAILLTLLTGYVALSHYIATRLLIVGTAVFLLVTFYLANRAIAAEPDLVENDAASREQTLPIGIRRRVARGLSILLDMVLFVIAIPVLMLSFGIAPNEISTLANRALFGFEVGGVEVSLLNIGFALGLFAVILLLTRMLQRWLGETVLHPSRTEQGLGNSIRTGIGYLGFGVAALAGLSYAGLDITNLALVAGALSVGIGFGLQSIVNNFVSGLILLVERPINVGDWIRIAGTQGHVRKISVRSTEIETFERASVIIPNSELISGTVTNLTLRNALGRITIPIGVSYASDPDLVQRLLLEATEESSSVSRHPAPFVVFEGFGDSSLDFSLRVYVSDVSSSLATQTELCKMILSKFRQSGIEIPFPQQDLHLRDLDGLKAALERALEQQGPSAGPDFSGATEDPGSNGKSRKPR
ncbi:MAG: DUF3772 domain-containing protein [Filomicrobium sp.]